MDVQVENSFERLRHRSALSRRLSRYGGSPQVLLDRVDTIMTRASQRRAGTVLLQQGDVAADLHVVQSGWAFRWNLTSGGGRVITQLLLPGDAFGHGGATRLAATGHVSALTDCSIATFGKAELSSFARQHPDIHAVLDWSQQSTQLCLLDHVKSLIAFRARKKVLHLLVSCWQRLRAVDEAFSDGLHLPLTQSQIGEICGTSLVHTNKSIARLRAEGMIELEGQRVRFPDPEAACANIQWDPNVLPPFVLHGDLN